MTKWTKLNVTKLQLHSPHSFFHRIETDKEIETALKSEQFKSDFRC